MNSSIDLMALAQESVYRMDDAENEKDLIYNFGRAMAFTELLFLRDNRYHDYMGMLSEISHVSKMRRARGFVSEVNTAL